MTKHNLEDDLNDSEKWLVDGLEALSNIIPSKITEDYTIKSGVYDVNHDIIVENCKLTIEKGVTLNFGLGKKLYIDADLDKKSQIETEGTETEPVILQAKTIVWNGITINNTKSDNILRYTTILDGMKDYGGGINLNNSILTLENCIVKKCEAKSYGGGICIGNNSSIRLDNTTIIGNRSKKGGGIYNRKSYFNTKQTTINENMANCGAGIYNCNNSAIRMETSIITKNQAKNDGGGIYNSNSSSVSLQDTKICENRAEYGAGIFSWLNSHIRMENTLINLNHAKIYGGGIFNLFSKIFRYGKNTIENNTPDNIY